MGYSSSFSKAIFVVIFIADKIRQGQYEFLSTKSISGILDIPKPTLVKILQQLHMAGIIETKEGKQGGIRLRKKPSEISVADILNAVEQTRPLFHTNFNIPAQGSRPDKAQELVTGLLKQAESTMKSSLAQKSIEEILIEMSE